MFYSIYKAESFRLNKKSRRSLKTQILKNRIGHMVCIVEDKLNQTMISVLSKILLKSNTVKLLFSNDNFLQTYSNLELYRYRNFSAYLKLIYSIRKNSTRKFILKAYFLKFTELILDFIPIKSLSLRRCVLTRIATCARDEDNKCAKIAFRLWRQITILLIPKALLFDKSKRILQTVYYLFFLTKKRKYQGFHGIQHYLTLKNDKLFLSEVNLDLSSINTVLNHKNYFLNDQIIMATSVSQFESRYNKFYSKIRENLKKEIKRKLRNTSLMKGVYFLVQRQLINRKIFVGFSQWRNKIENLRYQRINDKIEKYSNKKKNMSLILLEKIMIKINQLNAHSILIFFEKLVLIYKLKNTLKDYGYSYMKIPDLLNNYKDSKEFCILMRQTYSKAFKLMKINIMFTLKKHRILNNKKTSDTSFKLNNTFLKWKKFTMDCFAVPHKRSLAIARLITVLYYKELKCLLQFFQRFSGKENINTNNINEHKKIIIFVVVNINAKRHLIDKRNIFNYLVSTMQDKLRERALVLKDCVLAKFFFDLVNNKKIKNKFLRKWRNMSMKKQIVIKSSQIIFNKNEIVKTIVFCKTLEKVIKNKIFKWFKFKSFRHKPLQESRKIDYYVNLNQAKACLELEKAEKELDKLYLSNRKKLFITDILCKLFYKKSLNDGKRRVYKKWKNLSVHSACFTYNHSILLNEKNQLLYDCEQLESSMGVYKHQFDRVNEEYNEFKNIFCKNCLQQDECEILDNKSVNTKNNIHNPFGSVFSKSNKSNEFYVSNEDGVFIEPNKLIGNEMKLNEDMSSKRNDSNLKQKIVIIENRINTLKTEFDQKLVSNEKFLKIYEEKKKVMTLINNKELISIKKEIMSKLNFSASAKKTVNK